MNILTGLGMANKDKRTGASIAFTPMNEYDSENLYAADDMAEKVVDLLPKAAMREGFRVASAEIDDEVLDSAMDYFEKLVLTTQGNKFTKALRWGRQYGGAALIMGIEGDEDLEEPLDFDRVQKLRHFTLLSRYELIHHDINGDPESNNFGMPEHYTIQPRVTDTTGNENAVMLESGTVRVHYTKLIRFDGSELPRNTFIHNQYWHDSILNKLQNAIRDFQSSYASTAALILDFAQATYKIKGLASIVSSPKGLEDIQNRIRIIEMTRSVINASIVDADGEDFERKTTSLAGLDKVLEKISKKFSSATGYPHTVLFGESPSGLGATGESEKQDFYEMVRGEQIDVLKPRLIQIFKVIFAAADGPTKGMVPEKFDIEFEPLKHLDLKELVEARNKQAETDKIYIETGVLDQDEVAMSRYGSGEYSFETEINIELRDTSEFTEPDDDNDPEPIVQKTDSVKPKIGRSRNFKGKMFK